MNPEKPIISPEEIMINNAYGVMENAHRGQLRKTGEPYSSHPRAVHDIVTKEWKIKDINLRCASLLHDCVEDSNITVPQIKLTFNEEVAEIVDGVTKISLGTDMDTVKKVIKEVSINVKTALLKLADRLHNIRTLLVMPKENQIQKANETLEVYTKLAESLGLWTVKTEMEDLCYFYLNPQEYKKIKTQVDKDPRLDPLFTAHITSKISQLLKENEYPSEINIQKNGYLALIKKRNKLAQEGKCNPDNFNEVNDLISIRVILETTKDCYDVLGIIHQEFGPIVDYDRLDEFVGDNKRTNGYEAIQTTLRFPSIGPVEIALVTKDMENFNQFGVVSKIHQGQKNLEDYVLKLVFTPKGSIRFLPKNATGVDFAAALNPQLLADATHMLVDGEKKELTEVLPNAATIEIIFGKPKRAPLPNTEKYCLPETQKMISKMRILEERDTQIAKGKRQVREIIAPRGILELSDLDKTRLNKILYYFGCPGTHDLYFKVANGAIRPDELNTQLDLGKITKKDLGVTTLELKGHDKPGILVDIVNQINKYRKSITQIDQKNSGNMFELRILISGLSGKEEEEMKNYLAEDKRFSEYTIV